MRRLRSPGRWRWPLLPRLLSSPCSSLVTCFTVHSTIRCHDHQPKHGSPEGGAEGGRSRVGELARKFRLDCLKEKPCLVAPGGTWGLLWALGGSKIVPGGFWGLLGGRKSYLEALRGSWRFENRTWWLLGAPGGVENRTWWLLVAPGGSWGVENRTWWLLVGTWGLLWAHSMGKDSCYVVTALRRMFCNYLNLQGPGFGTCRFMSHVAAKSRHF